LSGLGAVNGLSFDFSSSDSAGGFVNTPSYFAIDNISYQAVPVPAAAYLFFSGLVALASRKAIVARNAQKVQS
jgi:hypothetical protein